MRKQCAIRYKVALFFCLLDWEIPPLSQNAEKALAGSSSGTRLVSLNTSNCFHKPQMPPSWRSPAWQWILAAGHQTESSVLKDPHTHSQWAWEKYELGDPKSFLSQKSTVSLLNITKNFLLRYWFILKSILKGLNLPPYLGAQDMTQ